MNDRKIEIKRNIIEIFLMKCKEFYKNNKRIVIYSLVSIVVLLAIIISGIVYITGREKDDIRQMERILDKYYSAEVDKEIDIQKIIDDLNGLIESSIWGYVNENGYYVVAGLYLSVNKYSEGKEYLLKFVDESPSSFFAPFALHRAGIACEKLNDYVGALEIYKRLEDDYEGSANADEVYYDLGRMYAQKGDFITAKEYYNKVITEYPMSMFTSKSKKRLSLLGYTKNLEKSGKN